MIIDLEIGRTSAQPEGSHTPRASFIKVNETPSETTRIFRPLLSHSISCRLLEEMASRASDNSLEVYSFSVIGERGELCGIRSWLHRS